MAADASAGGDAGGDSGAPSHKRDGAAHGSERARGEAQTLEPLTMAEGDAPALETARTESSVPGLEDIPEFDAAAQESSNESVETDAIPVHDRLRSQEAAPAPRAAGEAPSSRPVYSSAWVRNMLQQSARTFSLEDGWKVMEMQLEEGSGTMTVKTRRDENRVSVSVGFTDTALRTMVMANVDRLQQTLQAHYQSDVDLSLLGGGNGGGGDQTHENGKQGLGGSAQNSAAPAADLGRSTRTVLSGATNEWIG